MTTTTAPTPEQIAQVKSNVNNLMDFTNHVHDYLQDVIQEVFLKISEDPTYDPGEKFVTNLLDASFWSIGEFDFPGAGIISSFLGTFFGSYSGPDTPPSLNGTFGDVWGRFDAAFLQANSDLSAIYADPAGHWGDTFTNSETGQTQSVSALGDGTTTMPGKDDPLFQKMTDSTIAAYRVALTKQTIGGKWFVLQDPKGMFMAHWSESDIASWWPGFLKDNPNFYVTWHSDTGGTCCPIPGLMVLENFLGTGSDDPYFAGNAPPDMCNWLFKDDQFGTITNPNGIAMRVDVFCHWGLRNSLPGAAAPMEAKPVKAADVAQREKQLGDDWRALFAKHSRAELEAKLVKKAWKNPLFMRQLVRNPRETLEAELGIIIPANANVKVIQELPEDYTFVIPWAGRPKDD